MMDRRDAERTVGGLSHTSKMPCPSISYPIEKTCLRPYCDFCYGRKGRYGLKNVKEAMERRWRCYMDVPMSTQVEAWTVIFSGLTHFRMFDVGDVPGPKFYEIIDRASEAAPHCRIWIPTRKGWLFPTESMTIRHSIGKDWKIQDVDDAEYLGEVMSTVDTKAPADSRCFRCPATWTDNHRCGKCRACWDKNVLWISYYEH